MVAHATRSPALYPGHPHGVPGLERLGLVELLEQRLRMSPPRSRPCRGKVRPWSDRGLSDTLPPDAHMGPGTALNLSWVVLVCFLLN